MPAGLTPTDGMFTTRESAWHHLGVVFEDYPTRAQAQATAHPWEPLREDVYRHLPIYKTDPDTGEVLRDKKGEPIQTRRNGAPAFESVKMEGWYANVRSDNGFELGVVNESYVTVTNSELWDIAEALEQDKRGDVMFETGGSLRGGKQVWALVRLREPLVIRGDKHGATIPYFALQNSHDGTGAFRGQATMTRIVCMNTAMAADMDARARGTEFTFKHTKSVHDRVDQAQQALGGWRQAVEDWQVQCEELIKVKVTAEGVKSFLENFIPKPLPHLISEKVAANVDADRAAWMASYNSVTTTGSHIEGTAYGLVQASTEYANWARGARSAESRFRRTFLSRDKLTADSVVLALEAAKVDNTGQFDKQLATV